MKSRSSGYSSDSEQTKHQDLSLLRKPISTSLNGFFEVKRAFENGTEEIRRLLSCECDIIYECKLCRNIFRSLTNFLSHKRVYCRETFNIVLNFNSNNRNNFIDQDISTIIQAEEDYVNNKTSSILSKENSNSSSNSIAGVTAITSSNNKSNKDLTSIIDRLINREQENRLIKLNDFYDQVDNKLTKNDILKKNHILQLDRVPNSDIAVYQTIKKNHNDNIKTEVIEVNNLSNINTVLGPDGKILVQENKVDNLDDKNNEIVINDENNVIKCEVCNKGFLTEKTLILHLQTKHISSTYVYQCPSCSQTFLHPNSVIRHLSNDHKKSMRRIRQMRETIYKRHMRMDAVQMKPMNRELARLQTYEDLHAANNKAWIDNIERSPKLSPICTFCGKKFERKAVLNSHLISCIAKNRQTPPISNVKRETNQSAQSNDSNESQIDLNSSLSLKNEIIKMSEKNNENVEGKAENFVEPIALIPKTRKRRKKIKLIKDGADINSSENLPKLSNKLIKEIIKSEPANDDVQFSISSNIKMAENNLSSNQLNDYDQNALEVKENNVLKENKKNDLQIKDEHLESSAISKKPKKLSKRERLLRLIGSAKGSSRKAEKDFTYQCRICEKVFDALSNLRRHISMFHYRRRRFGCKCCGYRAFRRYDVVNHLGSFHLLNTINEIDLQDYILVAENNNLKDVDDDIIVSEASFIEAKEEDSAETSVQRRTKNTKLSLVSTVESTDNIYVKLPESERITARSIDGIKTKTFGSIGKRPKLTRSSSNTSNKNYDTAPKRPIRNRVKPVKKDFVYDLSHLLNKDNVPDTCDQDLPTEILYPYPRIRRRYTVIGNDDNRNEGFSDLSSSPIKHNFDANGKQIKKILIKGSAQLMAKMAVARYSACFNTPPEMPTERPLIPSRILAQGRTDNENEEIILNLNDNEETSVLIPNSSKFKGFDEMKKFKNSRRENSIFMNNRKRCFDISSLTDDSPSTRLLRNMNGIGCGTINNDNSSSSSDCNKKPLNFLSKFELNSNNHINEETLNTKNDKILVQCATNKEFQEYLIRNKLTNQVKSMNINDDNSTNLLCNNSMNNLDIFASINGQQNNHIISQQSKRITLIQRLAENQNRKKVKDSMLKNALEN